MKPGILLAIGGAALACAGFQSATKAKPMQFDLPRSDGKKMTSKEWGKGGQYVLIMLGNDCPATARAAKHYFSIVKAFPKARIVGMMDADQKRFNEWAKEFKPNFPFFLDKSLTTIKKTSASSAPWAYLMNGDGTIAKEWPGFSAKQFQAIADAAAKMTKVKPKALQFTDAPDRQQYG